jgi:hypothetical protein
MIVDAPWYVSNATLHISDDISSLHLETLRKKNNITSSPDLPALIKRDFKTTSRVKCSNFSMFKISPDDSYGRNRLN